MMFMTAKVNLKKIAVILGVIAAAIIGILLLFGGDDAQTTSATIVNSNDDRVKYLAGYGWNVAATPTESGQVRIPEETTELFDRYNQLQKSQGFDLSKYAGKNVMRYVYKVNNFPGATEPVYVTLLVHRNQIIGGDITDTAAGGKVQGFKKPLPKPGAASPTDSTEAAD